MKTATTSVSNATVSAYSLFWAFSRIALSGFGGVLPFAYRGLVEKREWLSPAEFAEWREIGMSLGFHHVESSPLTRSSYHAREQAADRNLVEQPA